MKLKQLQTLIQQEFADVAVMLQHRQITMEVQANDLILVASTLKTDENFAFEQLIDICGVDYLHYQQDEWVTNTATSSGFSRGNSEKNINKETQRFAVVYHLLSIKNNQRIRLKVRLNEDNLILPSVIDIWACANWYEREVFDLFGILFSNHPDLRRILTDYGFIGHPFRKDFPISGTVEMRYDEQQQRVIYQPVSIEPRTLVPKVIRKDTRFEESLDE